MQELTRFDEKTTINKISLRQLTRTFENWELNRIINEERVKELYSAYENRNIGILTSQFRWVIDNDKCFLLDGHHRKEAVIRLLDKFPHFDEELYAIIIIHNKNKMSDEELYKLHIDCNNCVKLEPWQIPTIKRTELINAIKVIKELKSGISKTPNAKTAYNYKISQNELAELAGKIIIKYPNMKINDIITNIIDINNKLCLLFSNDNFKYLSIPNGKLKKDVIEIEHKFFLNIKDSIYNKDVWINYLDNPSLIEEVLMKIKESQ